MERRYASIGRACASSTSTTLARFLAEADLSIEAQYGGWRGETLEDASPEIVTVARTAHR